MKRALSTISIIFVLMIAGCSGNIDNAKNSSMVDKTFMVYSLPWGEKWENIKDTPQLSSAKVIADDENRFAVEIEEAEFLDVSGTMVLQFSVSEDSFPNLGLTKVYFRYDDNEEQALIEQGERIYGERKKYFLDKDGIENPLNPSAWYSAENIEESLTDENKKYFSEILKNKNIEKTRADAIIRGPLVVISVDENRNVVELSGDNAAMVKNLKEVKK